MKTLNKKGHWPEVGYHVLYFSLFRYCTKKMKFSTRDFFSKCNQILRELWILVTFTEEIVNRKLHFLCNETEVEFKLDVENCGKNKQCIGTP